MPLRNRRLSDTHTHTRIHTRPFVTQNQKAEDLANRGGGLAQQGLEIFVQREEWDKVRLNFIFFVIFFTLCTGPVDLLQREVWNKVGMLQMVASIPKACNTWRMLGTSNV